MPKLKLLLIIVGLTLLTFLFITCQPAKPTPQTPVQTAVTASQNNATLAKASPSAKPVTALDPTFTAKRFHDLAAIHHPPPPASPPPFMCPTVSTNQYQAGIAYQFDQDDPVRPTTYHADKNLLMRHYTPIAAGAIDDSFVNYGRDDPTQPPQLATLFVPYRVPTFIIYYQVHHWAWQKSPAHGYQAEPIGLPPVTAVGIQTTPGEVLTVPSSGYDIGDGMEVLVIFADKNTVALRYTREDSSGSRGYTVHVDGICTDPNLLLLYTTLDAADGPRYQFVPDEKRPYTYMLPNLAAGDPIGVAASVETILAVVDSGSFMDPRSLDEWWQIRPSPSSETNKRPTRSK